MADKHIANAEARWRAICTTPDLCKVGSAVVPFDSVRDLSHELKASPNVNARGTSVYTLTGMLQGTDSNAGAGVVSQVSQGAGHVLIVADTTTVRVNGLICARHDSIVHMNVGPAGPNTVGRLQTEQGRPLGEIRNKKLPCNDPPKTSARLQQLQELKRSLAAVDPDRLNQFVRFADASQTLDEWIALIDASDKGGWMRVADWLAQGSRGVLGFAKDAVLGLGQLAYGAAKMANPAGMVHTQLDAQILEENVLLGNVCLDSVKQAAGNAWEGVKKPVVEAWEKGDHVEAVVRAGLEIGSLAFAVADLAKAGLAARARTAAKAGDAAKAVEVADATRAAEANRAADVQRAMTPSEAAMVSDGSRTTVAGSNGVKITGKRLRVIRSAEANEGFEKAPFKEGKIVEEYQLTENKKYVRLYDGENSGQVGRWIMPESEISGLTPQQIQDKFALPQIPTQITEVNVPSGTIVRIGEAGDVPGWGRGGGIQIQLMDRIPIGSYVNQRPFP